MTTGKTEATKTDLTGAQLVAQIPTWAFIGQSSAAYGETHDMVLSFAVGVVAYVAVWAVIGIVKLAGHLLSRFTSPAN